MDFNDAITAMQLDDSLVITNGDVKLSWRIPSTPEDSDGLSALCISIDDNWLKTMPSGGWFEQDWLNE